MKPPLLVAIAVVVTFSAFYLWLLWIGIRHVKQQQRPAGDVWRRLPRAGPLEVLEQCDKAALTVHLDGTLRLALFKLGPLKRRLLVLRFGLIDGHRLSRADAAWVLYRSEDEVGYVEAEALRTLGPDGRGKLEGMNVPRRPPRRPDSGGYQASGR